jgi:hypothetical protein
MARSAGNSLDARVIGLIPFSDPGYMPQKRPPWLFDVVHVAMDIFDLRVTNVAV